MKYLVVSDIHENNGGLEQCLNIAKRDYGGYDELWFLGDAIGHLKHHQKDQDQIRNARGQFALHTIQMIHKHAIVSVMGNWEGWYLRTSHAHSTSEKYESELAVLKSIGDTLLVNTPVFTVDNFIAALPPLASRNGFTLSHGSPTEIFAGLEAWEIYLNPTPDVMAHIPNLFFNVIATPHLLFGHTHRPGYFELTKNDRLNWVELQQNNLGTWIEANPKSRYAINPGSLAYQDDNSPIKAPTALMIEIGGSDPTAFRFHHFSM